MSESQPSSTSWLVRVAAFLGLQRRITGLLAVVALVGLGQKMGERFLPLYLLALGGGAISVGLFQALNNLLGALYAYPGGYLSDRIGVRRSLVIFNLVALAGFLIVAAVPAWPAVFVGAILFLSWNAVSLPAMMNLVALSLPPSKRTMGVTVHSLTKRIPIALGPLLGGVCIAWWGEERGVRFAFAAAAAAAFAALVTLLRLIDRGVDAAATTPPGPRTHHPLRLLRAMHPELRALLLSDTFIRFCEHMQHAFVVVWCMKIIERPVSAVEFGILSSVEVAAALLLYLPVAHLADRFNKRPFVLATFVMFTLFPVVLLLSRSFWPLVGAFALRGLKEFGEPTRKALIVDLCPPDRRATMFGFYYLVRDSIVALAAAGGALLWQVSPTANLLTAAACGAVGTLLFACRDGSKRQQPGPETARDTRNDRPAVTPGRAVRKPHFDRPNGG